MQQRKTNTGARKWQNYRPKPDRKSRAQLFARAIQRLRSHGEARLAAKIGFVIDATGSRSATWEEAQIIQARMFESLAGSPSTKLRIVYFGGGEVSDLGWEQSADIVARRMAEVSCRPGFTDILPSLARFLEKDEAGPASAIILIGDAYEEGPGDVEPLAQQLKSAGIKVFAFLEGEGTEAARAFSAFAEITDGKFARFGDELPLSDLCEGVALLTSGGSKGVKRIRNKNVRLLLSGPPNK